MRKPILIAILVSISSASFAEKVFDFNAECKAAYNEIIQLKLDNGQNLINKEKAAHPDNLIPAFLENYIDFFHLFFNEDPVDFIIRKKMVDRRLEMLDQGPESSPFFLFTKAVVNFQWASLRLKYGYLWDGGWELRRSFLEIKENSRKFPLFSPNQFFEGAMKVAISTIPDGYKWLGNLLGMKASGTQGLRQLEAFLLQTDEWAYLFRPEATFHYLMLKFYISNERDNVFDYMRMHKLDLRNNHLFAYMAVNLSINNQQSANAEKIIVERNKSGEYLQTSIWDLELAYAKMNHLDEAAEKYFISFLDSFKGKYYLKDVLHKLSLFYYLKDDMVKANNYRTLVINNGGTATEADQLALREAKEGTWPDKLLLKARLLNDGGYHHEALVLLQGKQVSDFEKNVNKIEFLYRVGRLYDDLQRDREAETFYKQVLNLGEKRREYYAARSALQLAYIYEQQGDKKTAAYWFNRCLAMKDHDFKNSLDQRSKAGLVRVEEVRGDDGRRQR